MSDALKKALRDEMFSVLNEGELTPARCSTLMRLADHGRELLRANSKKAEDFEDGTSHVGDQELPAISTETYGVKMLKELLPVLQERLNPKPKVDIVQLVSALGEAKRLGLDGVIKELEERLGVTGPRPILGEPVSMGPPPFGAFHAGQTIDEKFRCEVSDCWCRYAINKNAKPAPKQDIVGTVRAVVVDIETVCTACKQLIVGPTLNVLGSNERYHPGCEP